MHTVPVRHLAHTPSALSKWSTKDADELSDESSLENLSLINVLIMSLL